ncbi:MAG: YibE/F family protein [Clostridium sp.]|nr:YibE/F family protein [Clostridium sp.]
MNVISVLTLILLLLMTIIGGKKGLKSFLTLIFNFIAMFIMIILISAKINPYTVTILGCIIISCITLFFISGVNIKTISAIVSITLVVIATMIIAELISENAKIQGFAFEQLQTTAYLNTYVQLNFGKIVTCEFMLGIIGAVMDVSISIASSMEQIYINNNDISIHNLFKSGMNIGKDILGAMTNTLFFAYIASFMTLIIFFNEQKYSISDMLNAKVFCANVLQSLCSGIGIILIIPITALVSSRFLLMKKNYIS